MDALSAALLDKTRLPQPSLQRFAVSALFRRIESSHGALSRDAISHCLRSSSAAVVDQAVREICRLAASGDVIPTSVALIELQSALEGCEPRFAPVFVKGIGFLCRFAFRGDVSWGGRFDRVELHPFVKVLSCCEEAREELIKQVLLFIVRNRSYRINEVVRFLRPFIMFSMIWKTTSTSMYYFSRNLISTITSLSCSFPSEAISLLKLLAESLKYLPLTNEEEFHYIVSSAVHIVDAYVVVLQQTVDIDKDLVNDAQRLSVDVLRMLLSICTYFHRKPLGQVQAVIEISKNLLLAQKELGLHYVFEFVNIVVSSSVILTQVEFEHDQLSVLKLLILLMEWKTEELSTKIVSNFLNEELLIVFPAINLLSSPSKSVKAAVTHLLSIAESFILNFIGILKKEEISCTEFPVGPVLNEVECIPLRLLHHLFSQGQQLPYHSYLFLFTSDKVTCDSEKYCGPIYWTSWLRDHLSPIERAKDTFLPQFSENYYEGVNILLGSIASSLVISSALHTSAIDSLVALSLLDPKLAQFSGNATISGFSLCHGANCCADNFTYAS